VTHILAKGWLPLAIATSAALALWALAAAHGYAWQTIWLPAAVAGAAWPRDRTLTLGRCLHQLRERRDAKP
jgi:hypothetical protein